MEGVEKYATFDSEDAQELEEGERQSLHFTP
jgi:hypothetical protein